MFVQTWRFLSQPRICISLHVVPTFPSERASTNSSHGSKPLRTLPPSRHPFLSFPSLPPTADPSIILSCLSLSAWLPWPGRKECLQLGSYHSRLPVTFALFCTSPLETCRPPRVTFVLPAPGWSAPAYEANEMVRPNPAVGSQARQYGQSETHTVL